MVMPLAIAGSILGGAELGAAGLATARRDAPYVEKGLDKVSKIAKRGIATAKDSYNEADVRVRNFTSNKKYEVDLSDLVDGASAFVDGLPPSSGKLGAPIGALIGIPQAIENGKTITKKIKKTINDKSNKENKK
ncbi:hypothetical protein [Desulfovibrio gilichinskyi]|uniref:Uncharacterized protein n=1 Tax=Desulfovibrio gilichinskyi TaxID=1519643 RepID=A0A1X7E3C1_9BACT|nr:hypothetical protein [Desulfovibrio gilichinskyi]SMF26357.1 hypothetical protein SAMN06295933_2560 [Desulfovibrio gilichinskyi]